VIDLNLFNLFYLIISIFKFKMIFCIHLLFQKLLRNKIIDSDFQFK